MISKDFAALSRTRPSTSSLGNSSNVNTDASKKSVFLCTLYHLKFRKHFPSWFLQMNWSLGLRFALFNFKILGKHAGKEQNTISNIPQRATNGPSTSLLLLADLSNNCTLKSSYSCMHYKADIFKGIMSNRPLTQPHLQFNVLSSARKNAICTPIQLAKNQLPHTHTTDVCVF